MDSGARPPHALRVPRRLAVLVCAAVLLTADPVAAAAREPVDPATTACPPDQVERGRFADVPPGPAVSLAVDCLTGYGIARGTATGAYGPGALVTRGQMALFLDRVTAYALQATGSSAQRSTVSAGFDDLGGQSAAVVAAVDRLAAEDVVQGSDADGDGRRSYRPADPVTRGQMAAFLRRTLGSIQTLLTGQPSSGPSTSEDHFSDDDGPFEADIDAVASVGIAAGVTPTQFAPHAAVTRQQMALFLARLLEVEVAGGVFPSRYAPGGRPLDGDETVATPGAPVTVTRGLRTPWGLAPLPTGGALVSERDTALLKRVAPDGTTTTIGQVPGVVPGGEGGLLGIALSPTFSSDDLVYAYLTAASDNRVVRFPLTSIGSVTPIVTGIPKASTHNGGRIVFGPDGTLYVGTGDAGVPSRSQDPATSGGKVLRVTRDGLVPGDNPDPRSPVFSSGHRNVQGLAFDDAGRLWASELGQDTWDEVNLLLPGRNYGWPVVEGPSSDSRFVGPKVVWSPAEASPSGADVAAGSLWVAALRGQRLWQVPLAGTEVGGDRAHYVGQLGRLRAVARVAADRLWVLTNESEARVVSVPLS